MDLVVDEVMQFKEVRVTDSDAAVHRFPCTAIIEDGFAVFRQTGDLQGFKDVFGLSAVEDRCCNMDTGDVRFGHAVFIEIIAGSAEFFFQARIHFLDLFAQFVDSPAKVGFQNLTDIHTRRYAQGVQDDLDRRAIGQERHIFLAHDAGDDTLVAVTTSHLVAFVDLTFLGDVDADQTVYARRQFVVIFTGEDADVDDFPRFTMRYAQRRIADFAFLVAEDGAQQAFFRCQFRFAFRRDFADQDVAREDVGTDHDDAVFVEVLRAFFTDVGDFTGNFFRAQFRVAGITFVFFDVDGCVEVVLREFFTEENGVFVVIAFPRHVGYEDVVTKS